MRQYKRIYVHIKPERFSNARRHSIEARGLQLPGAPPGGSPRHAVLRPIPGVERAAHNPVLDLGKAETGGCDDDQCPGQTLGHGSNHAGPQYTAARERRPYRRRARPHRSPEQGAASDRRGSGTATRRPQRLGRSTDAVRRGLWRPARSRAARDPAGRHDDGSRRRPRSKAVSTAIVAPAAALGGFASRNLPRPRAPSEKDSSNAPRKAPYGPRSI